MGAVRKDELIKRLKMPSSQLLMSRSLRRGTTHMSNAGGDTHTSLLEVRERKTSSAIVVVARSGPWRS